MIGIVNYNMGNLASVMNAFAELGIKAEVQSDPEKFASYDKLFLPGVGAFGDAMSHLRKSGADIAIKEFATTGKPMLGICLGMQLLFDSSEEFGDHKGLGLIEGRVVKFDKSKFQTPLKIPHMGWNEMLVKRPSPIYEGMNKDFYLYFVHSYHAVCDDKYTIGTTNYGYEFVSSVQKENIFGIQPHPEKSHKNGLKILENFGKLK